MEKQVNTKETERLERAWQKAHESLNKVQISIRKLKTDMMEDDVSLYDVAEFNSLMHRCRKDVADYYDTITKTEDEVPSVISFSLPLQ